MKKNLKSFLFLGLFMGLKVMIAQNDMEVKISCFTNGDTASVEDIIKYPSLNVVNKNSKVDVKLISYNCVFENSDKRVSSNRNITIANNTFLLNEESIRLINALVPGSNFQIRDLFIEVTDKKRKTKEKKELPPITISIAQNSTKPCGERKGNSLTAIIKKVNYEGKLLMGAQHDVPLKNQKVILQDHSEKDLQTSTTNNYGDFSFKDLNANESYNINVLVDDDTKIKDGQLYAAKPDGTVIKNFNRTNKGFVYELLPTELNTLVKENEEDTELKIKKFTFSSQSELTVIENIYYESNSAEIKKESIDKLDKIISAMQNKTLKLLISSHTDSKGEDAYNITLSEKRAQHVMEYFILMGIEKERISAKGLGEAQIINRCKNGVDCSETEHQLNRRTEFKFTK